MDTFLLVMLVLSFLISLLITVAGFRVKTAENLLLLQASPTVFMILFMVLGFELSSSLYPGEDEYGYGIGFLVMIPTMLFTIISTTVLGIVGLVRMKEKNSLLLQVIAILSASSILTYMPGFMVYPVVMVVVILMKIKRKAKGEKLPKVTE